MDFVRASTSAVSGSCCHFQGITDFTQTQVACEGRHACACESFSLGEKKREFQANLASHVPNRLGENKKA